MSSNNPDAEYFVYGLVQGVCSTSLLMVAAGEAAPDFTLMDQNGDAVSLSSFKEEEKDVVVGDTCGI